MATSQAQSESNKKKGPVSDTSDANQTNGEGPDMFMPIVGAANLIGGSTLSMKRLVASSQELTRFYSERMKKDLSFMNALTSCKTPQDLTEVWYNAASSAVHDYANEFDRILAIGMIEQTADAQMRQRNA